MNKREENREDGQGTSFAVQLLSGGLCPEPELQRHQHGPDRSGPTDASDGDTGQRLRTGRWRNTSWLLLPTKMTNIPMLKRDSFGNDE